MTFFFKESIEHKDLIFSANFYSCVIFPYRDIAVESLTS